MLNPGVQRGNHERLLCLIRCGHIVSSQRFCHDIVVFRPITSFVGMMAGRAYEEALQQAILEGAMTSDELIESAIQYNTWSDERDAELAGYRQELREVKKSLLDFMYHTGRLAAARARIEGLEQQAVALMSRRHELTGGAAESYAQSVYRSYVIATISHTLSGERIWPSYEAMMIGAHLSEIREACAEYFDHSLVSDGDVRSLARSEVWRSVWLIGKNAGGLFANDLDSLTPNQKSLIYWSSIYDSVYQAYERPSSIIIDTDDLLDSWLLRAGDKTKPAKTTSQKGDRQETFVVSDRKGAQAVYDLNSPEARKQVAVAQAAAQQGATRDVDLPTTKQAIRQKIASLPRRR